MRENNLAYQNERNYNDIPDSPLLKKSTNTRTAGGVMIKIGKNKRLKLNTSQNSSRKKKAHAAKGTVISVVVLAAMAFLVLFRGLMIQRGYEKLEMKNAQLAAVISENQKIQFKIDKTLDLKNIENVAKNTYNMGEPTKAQTVYINLDQTEEVKKVSSNNSFFGGISNFFRGIVEYFS
ncbi:MAG: hypothetical protein J6R66_00520 [Clostridia bacterium]|nr:hypothetical protein [Clostridia bacterium]